MSGKRWTQEEIDILNKNINLPIDELCKFFPDRTKLSVIDKCKRDGLTFVSTYNYWTKEEVEKLKSLNGIDIHDLEKIFPDKLTCSIYKKTKELNINIASPLDLWTKEEDLILINNSNGMSSFEDIKKLLPHRTLKAIKSRFGVLKIHITNPNRVLLTKQNDYNLKSSKYNRYKSKWGIILDKNLLINTYNPIQWWKWYYYNTPNGNKMINLPIEIYNNIDSVKIIIKYVLENEINLNTRDKLLNLDVKLLKKYKIHFKIHNLNSPYMVVALLYPEYNIQPYEMKNVSIDYWKDINNADSFMKHFVENILCINELTDIKNQIPAIFTYHNIRSMGYGILSYIKYTYNYYNSFFDWLNKLYPEWNLEYEDFNKQITCNGIKLDSKEEVIVFDFLYENLGLDVSIVRNKKENSFYNEYYCENYIPDFIIKNNNGRDVIVEYFGLFRNNYGNSKILKDYYYKTVRKVEYFEKLKDYHFISIFNNEIKDLNMLMDKINNFLIKNNINAKRR